MTTLTDRPTRHVPAPRGATGGTGTGTPVADRPTVPPRTMYPLTWLRALAAFAVVTFHAYQYSRSGSDSAWPWTGALHRLMGGTELFVEMFFVLSGFVLWLPIARTALSGGVGRPGWVVLFRRMGRLLPLYYVVVLVVWALTNPSFPGHWRDLLLHLTFTQIYSDQYIFWTNGPAWSLAVEFHFYVLMALTVPLVYAAVRRTSSRRARLGIVLALPGLLTVTGLVYLAWATVWSPAEPTNWSVLFSPLSRATDFGLGTALAVVAAAGVRLGSRARAAAAVAGVAVLGVLVALRPETLMGEWWHPLYSVGITVALTSIVLHDGPWPAALEWRGLAWIGSLGYGIYLIHEPVLRLMATAGLLPEPQAGSMFLVTAVLVAVPSVLLAWLSSRTVEQAGLRVISTIDRQGRAREYYPHLQEGDRRVDGEDDRERVARPVVGRA